MMSILKKLVVLTVIAGALTLGLVACEPIEEGELPEQPPAEQPLD